jgi:hypothetical protein
MLADAAHLAVLEYRTERGEEHAYISRREAYRRFGRGLVDRWLREGLIQQHKDGTGNLHCRLSIVQLEAAAKSSNYASFFGSMAKVE